MLSIYFKMSLATQPKPSCKARWARRLSNIQNSMIITYSACYTAFIWTFYILMRFTNDHNRLTSSQEVWYVVLTVPKLAYEMSILCIFVGLFRRFNNLSKDYQADQKQKQTNFVLIAKLMAIFVWLLSLLNTILYDIVSPIFWHQDWVHSAD